MGFTKMKDKSGGYITVNDDYVEKYKSKGYTTDLNKPTDYNNLPANSVYRTENQSAAKNTYVPTINLTNTPTDYKPNTNQVSSSGNLSNAGNVQNNNYSSSILSEIQKAADAKKASRTAVLKNVLNTTTSNLNAEKSTIAPQYQNLKNNESSTAQLRAKRISEIMAQKGYSEGYQGQSELANNVAYRTNLGNLNTQQQSAYNDIAKRGTDAQNTYNTGLLQAEADIDTEASAQRLAELGIQRDYSREDLRNSVTDNRYADETAYNRNQDTLNRTDNINESMGYVNPTANVTVPDSVRQQLAQYSNDYTAYFNANPNTELGYYARVLANEKIFSNPELLKKYGDIFKTSNQKQQEYSNELNQKQFDYQKQRDAVSDSQWQKAMNLNMRQQTFAEAQQKIENSLAQQRISQEGASQALQWAKFNADQDPNSLDNQYKQAQINSMQTKNTSTVSNSIDDYAQTINSMFMQAPSANNGYKMTIDSNGIKNYLDVLIESGVDDSIIDSLAARYSIR